MELDLKEVLSANWTLLLFVILALGYLIAKIRLGGVPLGTTAGVLIAGLLFGHLGFPNVEGAATFGFTLFIFSVGLQAGPRFFSVFLEDGMRYIVLALVVAGTGSRWCRRCRSRTSYPSSRRGWRAPTCSSRIRSLLLRSWWRRL